MKIFNVEKGQKKIYVQLEDMRFLLDFYLDVPEFLIQKIFNNKMTISDNTRTTFIEFSKEDEIKYFESLDWIIDYKEINKLSEQQIIKMIQQCSDDRINLYNLLNSLTEIERNQHSFILTKCKMLQYKEKSLDDFLKLKQGKERINLPLIPDSDGFTFDGNRIYEMKQSIDPNKLLVYRKDGNRLRDTDQIDQNFIQSGISIAIMKRNKCTSFAGEFETVFSFSEDKRYLIIEFKSKEYQNKEVREPNKKGIKTKIRSIFTRNNK